MATTETEAGKAFAAAREEQKRFLPKQTRKEILQTFDETKAKVLSFIDQQGLKGTVPSPIDCDYVAERIAIFYARVNKLPILHKVIITYSGDPDYWPQFNIWCLVPDTFKDFNAFTASRIRMKHGGLLEEDRAEVQDSYLNDIVDAELNIGWKIVNGKSTGRAPVHKKNLPFELAQRFSNDELISKWLVGEGFSDAAISHTRILGELVPSHSEFARPASATFRVE